MNIGEISRLTGASAKAIRHYEAIGLLGAIARSGSYRVYNAAEVDLIRLIRLAQALGFKLSELADLAGDDRQPLWPKIIELVESKQRAIVQEIAQLEARQQQLAFLHHSLVTCTDYRLWNNPACIAPPK